MSDVDGFEVFQAFLKKCIDKFCFMLYNIVKYSQIYHNALSNIAKNFMKIFNYVKLPVGAVGEGAVMWTQCLCCACCVGYVLFYHSYQ